MDPPFYWCWQLHKNNKCWALSKTKLPLKVSVFLVAFIAQGIVFREIIDYWWLGFWCFWLIEEFEALAFQSQIFGDGLLLSEFYSAQA